MKGKEINGEKGDSMNLEKYIPFEEKKFRPHQKEVIEEILKEIEDGTETILLNAPVGAGKSLIGYCIAKYLEEQGDRSYIYTRTTFLQDQYLRDFSDIKTAMGRNNFPCVMSENELDTLTTCDYGVCKQRNGFKCPVGADAVGGISLREFDEDKYDQSCIYWEQKYEAVENPISILNYPYMIADNLYINHFHHRKLGIFDEGHSLESTLMSALEVEITDYQISHDLGMTIKLEEDVEDWVDQLEKYSLAYKEKANKTSDVKLKERYTKRYESLSTCCESLSENPNNWVFNTFEKKNRHLGKRVRHVVFKPIEIQEFTDLLFGKVDHKLIMSGSILKADIFVEELGLNDYAYIEMPSIVPVSQRPIIRDYVGSMSQRNFHKNLPFLVAKIKEIADNHLGEKGIIHTFTYNINYELFKVFRSDDRFIFHTQENREEKTREFKEEPDDEGSIFVSPYSYEGVDFPYDQARWQIICKNPYPYLGDAQVKARMEMDRRSYSTDWGWVNRQIALTLSQMYGRTNRAEDDYSVTYILDSDVERNFGPASLVTDYFLEALQDYNYSTPLEVVDTEKIKSRGINRENQFLIIDEINNGFDSLEKLRKEYKKLPSSSYVEVKKAIDYLLKCGAIRYREVRK